MAFNTANAKVICHERVAYAWFDPRAIYGSEEPANRSDIVWNGKRFEFAASMFKAPSRKGI